MRRTFIVVSLLAVTFLGFGCSQERPSQPVLTQAEPALIPGAIPLCGHDPLPDGYYSFFLTFASGGYTNFARINTDTGLATHIWDLGVTPEEGVTPLGLTFDRDGTLYTTLNYMSYVPEECWSQLARVDTETGVVTRIGPHFPMNTCGPDMDSRGKFYVCGMDVPHLGYIHGDGYLYTFNTHNGHPNRIGYTGMTDWMDLAFDSHDRLWATTQNKLFKLNTRTGASTFVADITGVPDADPPRNMEIMSIAFDEDDNLYGFGVTVYWDDPRGSPVMRINKVTGEGTLLGYSQTEWYGHGGDFIPENHHH